MKAFCKLHVCYSTEILHTVYLDKEVFFALSAMASIFIKVFKLQQVE